MTTDHFASSFDLLLGSQRDRLVRLCTLLSGDHIAAEDLAQETMLEAWRQRERLVDWSGAARWLDAIARFVCLRWRRRQGRFVAHHDDDALAAAPDTAPDLDAALEHAELADLLDRALGLLPSETRAVLVHKYIDALPHSEIARRLGISEGAVAMRAQRGRQAFRQVLATDLHDHAAAYGLVAAPDPDSWQTTRIWCPWCGAATISFLVHSQELMSFRCDRCAGLPHLRQIAGAQITPELSALSSTKVILRRVLAHHHQYYRDTLGHAGVTCRQCGLPNVTFDIDNGTICGTGLTVNCPRCGSFDRANIEHLMIDHPAVLRFWREHPRMRMVPVKTIVFAGQEALHCAFESLHSSATIEVVSATATFDVLHIESRGNL